MLGQTGAGRRGACGQPGDLRADELQMAFVGCACTWTQCLGRSGPVICTLDLLLLFMSPELMMHLLAALCTELSNLSLLLCPKLCSSGWRIGSLWGRLALGGERLALAWFGDCGFHVRCEAKSATVQSPQGGDAPTNLQADIKPPRTLVCVSPVAISSAE